MELNEFIKEFLPDYYNRLWSAIHNEGIIESDFEVQNFPEALQTFTGQISKKCDDCNAKSFYEQYA